MHDEDKETRIKVKSKSSQHEYEALSKESRLLNTNLWYVYKNDVFVECMTEMNMWECYERI